MRSGCQQGQVLGEGLLPGLQKLYSHMAGEREGGRKERKREDERERRRETISIMKSKCRNISKVIYLSPFYR